MQAASLDAASSCHRYIARTACTFDRITTHYWHYYVFSSTDTSAATTERFSTSCNTKKEPVSQSASDCVLVYTLQ
jgi:hypothetical protein